jgi:hypothetical protein
LAGKCLLHVHEKSFYRLLCLLNLLAVLILLRLKLLHVLVDLLLLFVEDFVLLHVVATILLLVFQVVVDVLDVPLVCLDDFADVGQLLVLLLDLRVVLLDAVHQTLSRLGEGQVHLVSLQFEVLLPFRQLDLLIAQMLSTLLESVLLQTILRVLHALVHVIEVLAVNLNFIRKSRVLALERLVLVALLRVEVVQTGFVGEVDVLDLLLVTSQFVLHVFLLGEESVEVALLLVVLVLDVHEEVLDIFGLSVGAVLVEGQVVVGQLAFELAHVLDEHLVAALESQVLCVVLVDVVDFLLHLLDLVSDLVVFVLEQVHVIVAVINLAARSQAGSLHAHHTMVGHRAVHGVDLGVITDTSVVDLAQGRSLAHAGAETVSKLHVNELKCGRRA